jgi:hypothetical protein
VSFDFCALARIRASLNLLVHPTRFERVTFAFGGQRSRNDLFYQPQKSGVANPATTDCCDIGAGDPEASPFAFWAPFRRHRALRLAATTDTCDVGASPFSYTADRMRGRRRKHHSYMIGPGKRPRSPPRGALGGVCSGGCGVMRGNEWFGIGKERRFFTSFSLKLTSTRSASTIGDDRRHSSPRWRQPFSGRQEPPDVSPG